MSADFTSSTCSNPLVSRTTSTTVSSISVFANVRSWWIWITLAVCLSGLVGTWWFYRWSQRAGYPRLAKAMHDTVIGTSLRKAQAQLNELERFEKE